MTARQANYDMSPMPQLPADPAATDQVQPVLSVPPAAGHSVSDAHSNCAGLRVSDDHSTCAGQGLCDTPHNAAGSASTDAQPPCADDGPGQFLGAPHTHTAGSEPSRNGHTSPDTRTMPADLERLHALLGHFARQLWDIQKVRIAMSHRVGAMQRDGLDGVWLAPAQTTADDLKTLEKAIDRQLVRLVKQHPLADWIVGQRGIGLPGFARLLGITGSLDRFATVSKLWAYLGMHVVDGAAPRRKKGEKANWSPQGRVLCHQIAESIVKAGHGPYRAAYDRKKGEYESDRPDWTQARRHNAAMRYAVKTLLKELWIEWRRVMPTRPAPDAGAVSETRSE
jgi:hypothetical protein